MTKSEQGEPSFGDKLAYLIKTVHPRDRGPHSYREIAAGIAGHPGAMTAAHINQLAKGKQPYPRIHHVQALASFFGVPVNFFFNDEFVKQIDAPTLRSRVWSEEQGQQIAERVAQLTPRDRATVLNLIDNLRAYDDEH